MALPTSIPTQTVRGTSPLTLLHSQLSPVDPPAGSSINSDHAQISISGRASETTGRPLLRSHHGKTHQPHPAVPGVRSSNPRHQQPYGGAMTARAYLAMITELVAKVGTEQAENVGRAADLLTSTLQAGGVIQAFGSGHSEAVAMEIAGRAGGLVPTNPIALRDLVLYGGRPRACSATANSNATRRRAPALRPGRRSSPRPVRDHLQLRRERRGRRAGAPGQGARHALIAITSLRTPARVAPRHPSGTSWPTSPTWCSTTGAVRRRVPCPTAAQRRCRLLHHRGAARPADRRRGGGAGCWRR